jgi:hypothetical protein
MVITMRDMACFNYTLRVCESATYAATTIAWQVGGGRGLDTSRTGQTRPYDDYHRSSHPSRPISRCMCLMTDMPSSGSLMPV